MRKVTGRLTNKVKYRLILYENLNNEQTKGKFDNGWQFQKTVTDSV